jgi:hypothetical protein
MNVSFSLHETLLKGAAGGDLCTGSRPCNSWHGSLTDDQWVMPGVDAKNPLQIERHFTANGSPVPIKQWDDPKSPLYSSETLTAIWGQQFTMGYNK